MQRAVQASSEQKGSYAAALTQTCVSLQISLNLDEIVRGVNSSDPDLCFQATLAVRYCQAHILLFAGSE